MCDIFARPSLSCRFSEWMRAAILGLPMRWWNRNASPSAQRCSNEWNPPGVMSAAGGMSSGGIAFTQIWPARRLKVGIMAVAAGHACDLPHTSPVPRGPNILRNAVAADCAPADDRADEQHQEQLQRHRNIRPSEVIRDFDAEHMSERGKERHEGDDSQEFEHEEPADERRH